MAMEEDDAAPESGTIRAAVRSAKKAARPARIGEPERRPINNKKAKDKNRKSSHKKVSAKSGSAFEKDLGQRSSREGVRSKKGDVIGGMGKKKGGKHKSK